MDVEPVGVPTRVRILKLQTRISADECTLNLDCQPAQRGELSIISIHLPPADLEDTPEQVFGGLDPEKALADDHKAGELQQRVRRKMLQLDLMLVQEPAEKVGG